MSVKVNICSSILFNNSQPEITNINTLFAVLYFLYFESVYNVFRSNMTPFPFQSCRQQYVDQPNIISDIFTCFLCTFCCFDI